MTKKDEIRWAEVIILPLVVGFALVCSNISMVIFKLIGWVLLTFGLIALFAYLNKLYKKHQEKVKKYKEEIFGMFKIKKGVKE